MYLIHKAMFNHAQEARMLLLDHGFEPIARVGNAEHFVRDGRHIILHWEGERPGQSLPTALVHARFVRVGEHLTLSL